MTPLCLHLNSPPPPIPPMPRKYEKTSTKDLKKKDKELQKKIISVQRQLQKLLNDKAHIECCLDYFQTDQDDFMNTLETNSTPPSEPEPDERAPSPPPLPVPPRSVSLWEHLGSTLVAALPKDNEWSRGHGSGHGTYHAGYSSGNRHQSRRDSDPLPEPFTLFGGRTRTPSPHRCRSPSYSPPPPLPPRPPSPHHQHRPQVCPCWECMHKANFI